MQKLSKGHTKAKKVVWLKLLKHRDNGQLFTVMSESELLPLETDTFSTLAVKKIGIVEGEGM